MPDLLTTSLSGMLAFQRAIETTGHNIANANTPGYSRQVTEFSTRPGQSFGNGYVGAGTQVTTIKRAYDEMLGEQLRSATTAQARFGVLGDLAGRISNLLAEKDSGVDGALQGFFSAMQDLANDPASVPARRVVLGEAESLAQRFGSLDGRLAELDTEVNARLRESVASVNRLARSIAEVNERIVRARGSTGQPPNDLLDQRDALVRELAAQVSVSTAKQDDGSLSVFIGSGQPLVIAAQSLELAVTPNEFDRSRLELGYRDAAGNELPLAGAPGGELGGLLDFRKQWLDPARQALGETAAALAASFNDQHAAGMTAAGELGGEFFALAPPVVLHSGSNGGDGVIAAELADPALIPGTDLVLEYDGGGYQLSRADTGEVLPLPGSGTVGDPFRAGGLEIVTGGTPSAGDRFLVRPAAGHASGLGLAIDDPRDIAMAAPVRTRAALENRGDAAVGTPTVADAGHPNLLDTVTVEFIGPDTYSINGAGAFAWNDGDAVSVNGVSFTLSGQPQDGDRFILEANYGASGDNANGLLLGELQSMGILDGGNVSISDNYGQLVAAVGGATQQVRANLDAQDVILANAMDAQLARSGVNLDEEAANLLRYQQAYQAAAHVVSVASTLFDTLLGATARR